MGFGAPGGEASASILAVQLRAADRLLILRLAMTFFGLLSLWRMFGHLASSTTLAMWIVGLSASTMLDAPSAWRRWHGGYAAVTTRDLRKIGFHGLLQGAGWAACLLFLSRSGAPDEMTALWMLGNCIMLCGAISFAVAPLAAAGFLLPLMLGVGAVIGGDGLFLQALAATYAMLPLVGCALYARCFAAQCGVTASLTEKTEVERLLLREFDDGGSDWLWQTDARRRIYGASTRLAERIGLEPAKLDGASFVQLLSGSAWESGHFAAGTRTLADHFRQGENFSNLILPVEVSGATRWWRLSALARHDGKGAFLGYRGVGSDITEQHEAAEKINRLARFDPLTGLPNRSHLRAMLDQAMDAAGGRKPGCAFVMIDLDRFKAVNDSLGHQIGDRLLNEAAARLRRVCADGAFCGRIGGDEFGVLVPRVADTAALAEFAHAIIDALSAPYRIDEHLLYVGASVGSALSPGDGRESEALIRSADLAVYRAKGDGGGVYRPYEPQLHALAEERRLLELALREALDKDQLHILYQPVVDAISGAVTGFEALVRWNHPELGAISPAKFVPVAEEARLIAPIGEWVLRTACAEAANWPDPVSVSVNVSAEQLTHANFVSVVVSALAHAGLDARRLELEVTESLFMHEDAGGLRVLDQLLALGVQLSLDDFGTGYSSLGYLRRTRFNTIKIDRSFVVGAANDTPESLAIIRAVVTLADSLGMATIAEGVETQAELNMVQRIGCKKVQGYYFGRPMEARDAALLFPRDRMQARA